MLPVLQIETTQAQSRTTASVDEFRKESHAANDQHIIGAIGRLNHQLNEAAALTQAEPQKLIGN